MKFIYRNARNETKIQHIDNVSITDDYYQGYCLFEDKLKTFRIDRILEMLSGKEDAEERLQYHKENGPPVREVQDRIKNKDGKPEICFTGFRAADKSSLVSLAEENDLFVRTSVTKKLDFLCCGYNAGPTKIETARHQGVVILTEYQLRELLETGEIPEQQS